MGKMITCLGAERGDIPYHMAVMLAALDKTGRTLCIDNSLRHDVFRSLKTADDEICQQGRVTFMHDKDMAQEILEQYQYIIVYEGYSMSEGTILSAASADHLLLLHDYSLFCGDRLSNLYQELSSRYGDNVHAVPISMLFIGKTGGKIKEKNLAASIGINGCAQITIEENPQDRDGYLNLQYNGIHKLGAMSTEYREALINLATDITGEPDKIVRRAAKK